MTVQEEWEKLDAYEQPLLDAYHNRDFLLVEQLILQAALIQHRIADWELGNDPDVPKILATPPTSRALFWLDSRTYTGGDNAWIPLHGSATVNPAPLWPGSDADRAIVLTPGTGITVTFDLPPAHSREFAVLAVVEPGINQPSANVLYTVDSETVLVDFTTNLWTVTGNSDSVATTPTNDGWNVIGHKIGLVDLTAIASPPVSVIADNPADRFEANRTVTITVGPDFAGRLLALAAYSSLVTNQKIPHRINGFLAEYGLLPETT